MKKKIHVLLVHGGTTFKRKKDYLRYLQTKKISMVPRVSWSGDYLDKTLGKSFHVIRPRMPMREDAKYQEWKIYFERHLPFLKGNVIFIGNSLGGIFLAKYLSEHKLKHKALSVYLVCAPFDNTVDGEDLVGGFTLKPDLSLLPKNTKNLHLLFSKDDDVVPVSHAAKYAKKLPNAHIAIYTNKHGHFNVTTFPEIVALIKKDVKK